MTSTAQSRTIQVLRFLREFDQIRNKPLRHVRQHLDHLYRRDFPLGRGCALHLGDFGVEEEAAAGGGTPIDSPLLTVVRQRTTPRPAPPETIDGWLEVDGTNPERPPAPRSTRARERFEESADRVEAFESWLEDTWRPWARSEAPRRRVQALYEHLYDLHLRLRREGEEMELVWASGLLAWRLEGEEILHPLVLAPVSLVFDRNAGRIMVVPTSGVPGLADDIFQGLTEHSFAEFDALAREFREAPIAPWDRPQLGPFLGRLANVLGTRGTVVDVAPAPGPDPVISRDDLLILRKRRTGYGRDIERWLQILEGGVEPPATIRQVVGVHDEGMGGESADWLDATSLLFPLAANPQQEEIARRLAQHPGVVVQGPPGTGKSHTIANLVSHLLAHGKTILITSQTERALRVLRDKVPESIRSLCVSVTGSDVDSQEELKRSVQTIIEGTGGSRDGHAREASRVRAELDRVRADLAAHWERVSAAARAESAEVTIAGRPWTPTRAAEYLRDRQADDGWLPDRVAPATALPLLDAELKELEALLARVARHDVQPATQYLPDVQALPSTLDFRDRVEQADRLRAELAGASHLVTRWRLPDGHSFDGLLELLAELRRDFERALEDLATFRTPWIRHIRREIALDTTRRDAWERLAGELARRRDQVLQNLESIAHRSVEITLQGPLAQRLADVQALHAHVARGGRFGPMFGLLYRRLKRTRAGCRVDGTEPSTTEHLEAVLIRLRVEQVQVELQNLVANQIEVIGGPSLRDGTTGPEHGAGAIVHHLSRLLAWQEETWERLRSRLSRIGCDLRPRGRTAAPPTPVPPTVTLEEAPDEIETAQTLIDVLSGFATSVALEAHEAWQDELARGLEAQATATGASPLWGRLAEAVRREDVRPWEEALEEGRRLGAIAPDAHRLVALSDRLAGAAPRWTAALLEGDDEQRGRLAPERARAAWAWSQVNHWIEEHLAAPAPEDLRRHIDTLKTFENEMVGRLVEHSTWAALRTGEAERQALAGWQQAIARIGKGTGKRVPQLRREAQTLMSRARRAVPVWIMPLGRVIDNFSPDGPRFDVVVVDESSQADTFGLLALLRAERAVVVGDDNQISPAAVGQRLAVVDQLIEKHLQGIPNDKLWDGQQSLYDLATAAFGGVIRLREHFRCVPEIISFSNGFYANEIQPLRDPSDTALVPPVVLHRVAGFRAPGSDVNELEADWIAALVAACCAHPAYKEATLGVISLLGEEQARAILERVRRRVAPEEIERRAFIAGDAYHFQGDERDVMFLSLVEAPGERRPAVLNRRTDQQRFNVAASRARDQMWLVHSIDAAAFHPQDMRGRLLTHFAQPGQRARNWRDVEEILRDDAYHFQRLVARQIIDRGYRVRAEVRVGPYRIDLVVDGESDSLGVECDGERWHTLDNHRHDVARQITLERLGWKFLRIRGGHYFRDPEAALAPLWRRLHGLGIRPASEHDDAAPVALAAEIIRRAEELLRRPVAEVAADDEVADKAVAGEPYADDETSAGEAGSAPWRQRALSPEPISRPPLRLEPDDADSAASAILAFLQRNPGWHGRQAIVSATNTDDEWRDAIDALLVRGLVHRRGVRRGTKYRAATDSEPPPSRAATPTPSTAGPPHGGDSPAAGGANGHALDVARRALIQLREESLRPAFAGAPAERGLLRRAMLEAFLTHRPTTMPEYERRISEYLRAHTDPAQLDYLPAIFDILTELPRP